MGDDEPSCELNRLDEEGSFFGFPFKHARDIIDPEYGNVYSGFTNIDPILELGAHVAPTGVSFYRGEMFPLEYQNNLFITLHGSWNRSKKSGYKVIRVIFNESGEVVKHENFITGFLSDQNVHGRPSSVFTMIDGSMLVADDFADKIYRVTYN
jgi:glucose/arabinose dehydrogenase